MRLGSNRHGDLSSQLASAALSFPACQMKRDCPIQIFPACSRLLICLGDPPLAQPDRRCGAVVGIVGRLNALLSAGLSKLPG